jgi:hypothetical protein
MADHPADELVRQFQDRIVAGTWNGLRGLDEAGFDGVMACQAASCAQAYVQLFQIPDTLDLDGFLERMVLGGSSKIEIRREGNTIRWEEIHGGECMCPLVKRGVVPLEPGLCRCAVHWVRDLFARHVKGPVHVRLLDSVALGAQNCTFEVVVDDPSPRSAPEPDPAA